MKKHLIFAVSAVALSGAVPASAATIDFGSFAPGTVLSNQIAGVSFSVAGGPASGTNPVIGLPFGDPIVALTNGSDYTSSVNYPTFSSVLIDFSTAASDVSFTFHNFGDNTSFASSTVFAYDSSNSIISSANIGTVNFYGLINVAGSGISRLEITNGSDGSYSWLYGIGALNYTSVSAAPEPSAWLMMIIGFGLVGGALRQRRQAVKVSYS